MTGNDNNEVLYRACGYTIECQGHPHGSYKLHVTGLDWIEGLGVLYLCKIHKNRRNLHGATEGVYNDSKYKYQWNGCVLVVESSNRSSSSYRI